MCHSDGKPFSIDELNTFVKNLYFHNKPNPYIRLFFDMFLHEEKHKLPFFRDSNNPKILEIRRLEEKIKEIKRKLYFNQELEAADNSVGDTTGYYNEENSRFQEKLDELRKKIEKKLKRIQKDLR